MGDFSPEETREIVVATIEPRDQQYGQRPKLTSNLPFLYFREGGIEQEPQGDRFWLRKRTFIVGLSESPPSGTTVGKITIEDPWNPGVSKDLPVLVRPASPLTASPSTVRLDGAAHHESAVVVISDDPLSALTVETVNPGSLPIDVRTETATEPSRAHRIKVSLRETRPARSGRATLKIRAEGMKGSLEVPVIVR